MIHQLLHTRRAIGDTTFDTLNDEADMQGLNWDKVVEQGAGAVLCLAFMLLILRRTIPTMTERFSAILSAQQAAGERTLDKQHAAHKETLAVVVEAGKQSIAALGDHISQRLDAVTETVNRSREDIERMGDILDNHMTGLVSEARGPHDYRHASKGAA